MNFEKALEAMKQGKKVKINFWEDSSSIHFNEYGMLETEYEDENFGKVFTLNGNQLLSDDWEIYEPLKELEMTAEKAVEILRTIRKMEIHSYRHGLSITEFRKAIEFAIEIIENNSKNKPEKECDCKCNKNCTHGKEGRTYYSDGNVESAINRFTSRLLKDYDKECRQQSERIRNLEGKQGELWEENSVLRERLELLENENRTLHEIINKIRVIAECRRS